MTLEEALEFFAAYGNVASEAEGLRRQPPTLGQLSDAVRWAKAKGQDPAAVEEAKAAIISAGHISDNG
jgi:hypothetical protein